MSEKNTEKREKVYELGYLLVSSIPAEKLGAEVEAVKSIITKSGAEIIAEGEPKEERLAYTMRKKTISGSYDKYDNAYFGWIKYAVSSSEAEGIKKSIETLPTVLRYLIINTVRENTYLGKRASLIAQTMNIGGKKADTKDKPEKLERATPEVEEAKEPASMEEVDKSIDAMVKEI